MAKSARSISLFRATTLEIIFFPECAPHCGCFVNYRSIRITLHGSVCGKAQNAPSRASIESKTVADVILTFSAEEKYVFETAGLITFAPIVEAIQQSGENWFRRRHFYFHGMCRLANITLGSEILGNVRAERPLPILHTAGLGLYLALSRAPLPRLRLTPVRGPTTVP